MQGNLLKQTEEVVDVWQEEGGVRLQEQLNIFVRDIALVQTHLKKLIIVLGEMDVNIRG